MINYKYICRFTAFLSATLFVTLLFFSSSIFSLFQLQENESAIFVLRRTALLFLGLSIISWGGQDAPPSDLRQSFCLGMSVAMFGLAITGILAYWRGFVGVGVMLSVFVELAVSFSYFYIWWRSRLVEVGR
ncbi:hypothetical protein QWI17_07375 [Gilvimarinus sp. SDUM040013]|uniref:DUF4345 domain-containing protein n=1 Tax=Gilvimarinus gilvus TaxID=3058038 RepID=A0ABU4S315_9GAMM|nr:hypothetical protein [Gilvimarinus sp. SDUM040013]MDO3385654.1 hypothetical protein [Gilvimarinus sp. SDUM040013]MDX6851518.1 hypothetical protein [Gilvimarinus sp. SDUM040013]